MANQAPGAADLRPGSCQDRASPRPLRWAQERSRAGAHARARFDFALNEQCFQYHECTNNPAPGYRAFTRDGKAVFQVEYRLSPSRYCGKAAGLDFASIKKARDFSLTASPWEPCT